MTVCIAAQCLWDKKPYIVIALDRQLTAGDIEYEPASRTKLYILLSNQMAILQAGTDNLYTMIANETERIVAERQLVKVNEVARVYSEQLIALRRRQAEIRYLAPLGLDMNTFVTRQRRLRPEIAAQLKREITDKETAELGIEAIVAGIDSETATPHIYKVADPGGETCEDGVGFAAVGEGCWHAESVFMLSRYDAMFPADKAIVIAYMAKKRAELASSVGRTTDLFVLHPTGSPFHPEHIGDFVKQYGRHVKILDRQAGRFMENLSQIARQIIT